MKKDKNEIYALLLENSKPTIARWKAEKRPIINLLDKYFSIDEIKEFIETGKINKLEIKNEEIIKDDSNEENFFSKLISYDNINMKRIIKDWGIQGYGIAVGIILYLKENSSLDLTDIDILADDLRTSTFLIEKVIEDCNFFSNENNIITLRVTL